ncbi:DUF2244 domain-containing protein [Pseudoduganella plicata]|uniref:DUF2244 domain-containing protein n=1 Tax=Pseudoduganella plicata TaxID=321984 RepID=UPI00141ACF56|nr:DUF2244 domain-containing protein [Pseudoduganella plicata]
MKRDWHTGSAKDVGRREWLLKRNCSLTPRQTITCWAVLVAMSLGTGLFCTWHGAPLVLLFTALEITVVTAAFVFYSRHATDFDRIVLDEGRLTVDKMRGGTAQQYQLEALWLRVTPPARRRDPVRLAARDVTVEVGSYLLEPQRRLLARELREALAARGSG